MKHYTVLPLTLLDMGDGGCHLIVKIKINQKVAIMVLDTGASKSVFDKERFERFVKNADLKKNRDLSTGLGTNTVVSHSFTINKLKLGNLIVKEYPAVLMNLSHVNESYESMGFHPMDGVLGSDILYEFKAIIDYSKLELKLHF